MKLLSLGCLVASAVVLLSDVRESHASPVGLPDVAQDVGQYAVDTVNNVLEVAHVRPKAATKPQPKSQPQQMLCLVNRERKKKGLRPVALHPVLMDTALEQSRYQAQVRQMTHKNPVYGNIGQRMSRRGFRLKVATENIASVPGGTPQQLFAVWCSDAAHYNNMLNRDVDYMGLANINGYWTQDFGARLGDTDKAKYFAVQQSC
ncbi:hypothetical protein IWQ56_004339 [Coemansia nantahalensis]|uniref:Uncharacterized protein n=2 Tax=Coemansia TaxID=4863 RepID=A0ACC1L143_9FUNG|nr:hypothetical protein IWQ56_004339 [Coemansia nantahalensis]KAJ2769302.1 hypothetical protein IWQ57_003162 [Coemansia nantahalensis]KAJ2798750.1 hypothetical protein H4R21_003804 [Coemansia helicoidea]